MPKWLLIVAALCFASPVLAASGAGPFEVLGNGVVTDSSHPLRPGDFAKITVSVRVRFDPIVGEAEIAITPTEPGRSAAVYYIRRGRTFQCDAKGEEKPPGMFGDLSAATVAALHAELVEAAMTGRPELVSEAGAGQNWFAWNDEMWSVKRRPDGSVAQLARRTHHDVRGGGREEITYQPGRVVIAAWGREIANIAFDDAAPIEKYRAPTGDTRRDRVRVVPPEEMAFKELAAGIFAVEMPSANSRMIVAEFADHLFVFEGAYTSGNCDRLAAKVAERFKKPVRYFAFSHLHGQYVAGVRSWVHAGATVLIPPSTEPLVKEVMAADFSLRPDAQSLQPAALKMQLVPERWSDEDAANAVVVHNTSKSEHTDEYLLVYFPREKVLLTGDLLFLTPGQPLKGRSLRLYQTIGELGLEVDLAVPTWPLEMAGIKNLLTGDELRAAGK